MYSRSHISGKEGSRFVELRIITLSTRNVRQGSKPNQAEYGVTDKPYLTRAAQKSNTFL